MAKIILPSFDELILPEDRAKAIYYSVQETKKSDINLSMFPITITHNDGMWVGSMADLDKAKFLLENKQRVLKHKFKSEEDLKRFHNEYGYGCFKNYTIPGYGLVDIQTQFLIKTNQAKLENNILLMLNHPHKEKWMDLWEDYKSKLDIFDELRSANNK